MPFCAEYQCERGHRFTHLHMGSRDTLPRYIPCEGKVEIEVAEHGSPTVTRTCSRMAEKMMSAPSVQTIVKGNSDFNVRQRERLEKRSADWSNSKKGKQTKMESIERQLKKGNFV